MTPARSLAAAMTLALALSAGLSARPTSGPAHPSAAVPWSDVVEVRGFDPRHGELVAVRLVLEAYANGVVAAENATASAVVVATDTQALARLALPGGEVVAQVPFAAVESWVLAPFDGRVDFAGSSGQRVAVETRGVAEVWITAPAEVLYFLVAPESDGVVALPVAAVGAAQVVAGEGVVVRSTLDAGVRVRVEYVHVAHAR